MRQIGLRVRATSALAAVGVACATAMPAPAAVVPRGDAAILQNATRAFVASPTFVGTPVIRQPFATVEYAGRIENQPMRGQLLFRRYGFGWQFIDLSVNRFRACDLASLGVPATIADEIVDRKLPASNMQAPCRPAVPFAPPSRDEEAVRRVMGDEQHGREAIPSVVVEGNNAVGVWEGFGGGQTVFARDGAGWRSLGGGGGAMNGCDLVGYGVQPAIAKRLMRDLYRDPAHRQPDYDQVDHWAPLPRR